MMVPPYQLAVPHIWRNSSSDPNAGSIWVLMRSKCPSTLGVSCQPEMPPARFTGPVCTAWIPISANAFHRAWSDIALRNDSSGRVISDSGYAVNHTDAVSTAVRGFGRAKGFCHIEPWPENCWLISLASASIDCDSSQET